MSYNKINEHTIDWLNLISINARAIGNWKDDTLISRDIVDKQISLHLEQINFAVERIKELLNK